MRCDFAEWLGPLPTSNFRAGPAAKIGMVHHVIIGSVAAADSEFHNPAAQLSAHFGVADGRDRYPDGHLVQWVDTDDVSYAQVNGNGMYLSVETAGTDSTPFTAAQIATLGHLDAWAARVHRFPVVLVDHGGAGLTTHAHYPTGVPDPSWGNHPCLPLDVTDVLTARGWKPLGECGLADEVASWNPDSGLVRFDRPLAVVDPYESATIMLPGRAHRGNPDGGWLEMTADHRVYANTKVGGAYKTIAASEFGSQMRIPLAGFATSDGLPVSDDHLRMLVWTQADGSYEYDSYKPEILRRLHFHFQKQRKVDQVCAVLDRLGVEYQLRPRSNGTQVLRIADLDWVRSEIMRWLPERDFTWEFLGMNTEQFAVFAEELMLADGCVSRNVYRSSTEINLDVVQALCHLHGRRAVRDAIGTGLMLDKDPRGRNRGPTHWEPPHLFAPYKSAPRPHRDRSPVGCLTTVDGTMMIRQRGRVAIVGNCPGSPRIGQMPLVLAAASPQETLMRNYVVVAVPPPRADGAQVVAVPGIPFSKTAGVTLKANDDGRPVRAIAEPVAYGDILLLSFVSFDPASPIVAPGMVGVFVTTVA